MMEVIASSNSRTSFLAGKTSVKFARDSRWLQHVHRIIYASPCIAAWVKGARQLRTPEGFVCCVSRAVINICTLHVMADFGF